MNIIGQWVLRTVSTVLIVGYALAAAGASGPSTPGAAAPPAAGPAAAPGGRAPEAYQSSGYRSIHLQTSIDGFTLPFHVTVDGDMIYTTDVSTNQIRVHQIVAGGVAFVRNIGAPGAGAGQLDGPEQVAIVGTDLFVADFNNHRVQRFNKSTGAYISQFGSVGSGSGQFVQPSGLVYNPANGLLYVSDLGNDRVQIFTTAGTYVGQFAGPGAGNGQLNNPYTMAVDRRGNLYVADSANSRAVKFNASGAFLRNIAIGVTTPMGVTLDAADHLWITSGAGDLYCYDSLGNYISYYYGTAPATATQPTDGYFASIRGLAMTAPLAMSPWNGRPALVAVDLGAGAVTPTLQLFSMTAQPTSHPLNGSPLVVGGFNGQIAFDSAENVYVTSYGANSVYKFDKAGNFITQWGSAGNGNGQFNGAYGITIDDSNNVYVVDTGNSRIQKFSSNGTYLTQWGSFGNGDGQFANPGMIATDGAWIYVTDEVNQRVQKFSLTGAWVRKWGIAGAGNGQFQNPAGIAVDRNRNLVLVAEYVGNRVQQFTVFGDFVKVFADGTSGAGVLGSLRGLATDQAGNVYVSDSGNGRVLQFNDNGTYLTSFTATLPNGIGVNPANGQLYVGTTSGGTVARYAAVIGKNDTIGVYRPADRAFLLRSSNTTGPATIAVAVVGATATDLPVTGDWNGDGIDTPGLYRPSTNTYYLWDRWYDLSLSIPDYTFTFGIAGDLPIAGDWSADGRDGVGVYRPTTRQHLLRSSLIAGAADYTVGFGLAGDVPVAGDWNTDGASSAGVYRGSDASFHGTNVNANGSFGDNGVYPLGVAGDHVMTGDWTHAGYSGLGVFHPANSTFALKYNLDSTPADSAFQYVPTGVGVLFKDGFDDITLTPSADLPLAGAWGSAAE